MQNYTTIMGIIRMRQQGLSYRQCHDRFKVGNSTITLLMARYQDLGLSLTDLEKMDSQKVVQAFYPPDEKRRKDVPLPDFKKIHERLMEKGSKANLFFLWTEYKQDNPNGYQYSQFAEYYHRYVEQNFGSQDVSMAVERIPGEKVFIDWVGDQPEIIMNPESGELQKVHVFVTTVGVSSYLFAELFPNEQLPNFMKGTNDALAFYDAVPKYLVPDNAATAVAKHTKDVLLINSTYQDLESFYGTIILPPPAYKPKGKPTVEKHVQLLETWLLKKLKENVYSSFASANEACKKIIADINDRKPTGWEHSRKEMFELYDKPQMKKLSDGAFTTCDYVAFDHIPANYHLPYDGHYYSVLYTYYNRPAILKAPMTEIRICDENNRLLCTHSRSYKKFPKYITNDEHMSPEHRFYKEVNMHDGDYYRRWASVIGKDMFTLIDTVLHSSKHEEQSYNSCNGILHMCDGKSKVIVNMAARKCIELNSCKYSYFKRILNDILNNGGRPSGDSLPEHKNIRGKDFYK